MVGGSTVKEMTTNFGKLDKFKGHDYRRWQKKMHFLLTTLKVVYVLTTPMPELLEDDIVEAIRHIAKWENDDYICRGHIHILNDSIRKPLNEFNAEQYAIMEAGGWNNKPVLDSEGNPITATAKVFETYQNVSQEIRDQLNAEAEAVQIILTGIDNDTYSTVDACPNACEMWKAIERLKQDVESYLKVDSINVQDLKTNLYWDFGIFTSRDGESLKSYYSRFYKMMNELVRNKCEVTSHQVNIQFLLQLQPEWQRSRQAATRNRGKAIVNSPPPIYDQEPDMDTKDDALSKEKKIDKLMALISMSFKKIYKPTNNNLKTSSNTSRAN
nr:zinc finger, CCHC-type [Tanacetum cinerariifolium]